MATYDNIFDFAANATSEESKENWHLTGSAKIVHKEDGNTPLHIAAMYNSETGNLDGGVMAILLTYGAKINAKNKEGKTPLDVASTEEKKEFLRKNGARSGLSSSSSNSSSSNSFDSGSCGCLVLLVALGGLVCGLVYAIIGF